MGKRSWWRRSLDRHFRFLEGRPERKRDPHKLREEIANRIKEIRKETKEYNEKFQEDVKKYAERLGYACGE
ncbi:MAG: hypothetical protein QMD13_06245 [Candidatus Bathyarchaeia archaeon]|nr:hypothetical protein [Candidatus Bathyarchaeia archaeon]